ncbi:unnamed protein product [Gongylonema pulchrum]|uniref:Small ribosomal subunit protein uS9 n=1 Tax=Gongylonema pulchrum TaxID=637853 RepID=A0A183E4P5_9BILA|nr:unnamed protein product [Gongylonema pulchrum]
MVLTQSVQVFGRKKTATAVAYCKKGRGLIKVNGRPLEHIQPEILRIKLQEPLLVLGKDRYQDVDIRVRVHGGGHVAQVTFFFSVLPEKAGFFDVDDNIERCPVSSTPRY